MTPLPGEIWLADLGLAAKTRPVVILSRHDLDAPRRKVPNMNRAHLMLLATLVAHGLAATPCPAQQMWAPSGVPLCLNGCPGDIPRVVTDGARRTQPDSSGGQSQIG